MSACRCCCSVRAARPAQAPYQGTAPRPVCVCVHHPPVDHASTRTQSLSEGPSGPSSSRSLTSAVGAPAYLCCSSAVSSSLSAEPPPRDGRRLAGRPPNNGFMHLHKHDPHHTVAHSRATAHRLSNCFHCWCSHDGRSISVTRTCATVAAGTGGALGAAAVWGDEGRPVALASSALT